MHGEGGTDTVNYASSAVAVNVDLAMGVGIGGDARGDTYSSMENAIGSSYADVLVGGSAANALSGKAGDDTLDGGAGNDTIDGGSGNDSLTGGAGDDTFVYSSGNDTIAGGFSGYGSDTLDLSQYNADQVSFVNVGNDVVITTPGGTITLDNQITWDLGFARSNIDNLIFADGTLDEAGIRARAVADQSTAGDDAIVATQFNDILNGGAGNDILTGGSGADIIELDFGSGSDTMTDFEDGLDIIDLSATGLTFTDLTIADNGSGDVVISFDDGDTGTALDELTLTGITASELTSADFKFG